MENSGTLFRSVNKLENPRVTLESAWKIRTIAVEFCKLLPGFELCRFNLETLSDFESGLQIVYYGYGT